MTKHRIAKFNSMKNAQSFADRSVHPVGVILGCDGRFWVPATLGDFGKLIGAGYETAR